MNSSLSADRPQTDPSQDLFGYAPFAQILTKALCNYGSSDPLVLGLNGAWGSGKSTILKFICHNLKEVPENERPIVIEFNPWWFSGQENLARAFLGQLQAALPKKYAAFKKLGELLGNFSESIGGAIDTVAPTGGFGKKVGSLIKSIFKRPPKDVPALKKEICDILQQSGKRIIIMIDDIDRLEAEEMRQLFTVIKALADFPNVIYLLAFDQAVVVRAIEKYSGMPGQAYLEKIIQVPFVVPQVDREALVDGLKKRLEEILAGTPEVLYPQSRWNSFFDSQLDKLFTVPRDIIRFCNTVAVTYPAVRGEVNAVDFIVIEAIRVFLPELYMHIRDNQDEFIGTRSRKKEDDQYIENILNKFVKLESMCQPVKKNLEFIFPDIVNDHFVSRQGRRSLPIRNSDIFPCYFRFNPSSNTISNTEMLQLLEKVEDAEAFASALLQAKEQDPSRARKLLDRLQDYIDGNDHFVPIVGVLLNIGDDFTSVCSQKLMLNIIEKILLGRHDMKKVIRSSIKDGRAYKLQYALLEKKRESNKDNKSKWRFFAYCVICKAIKSGINLQMEWGGILGIWRKEEHDKYLKKLCTAATQEDAAMLAFIHNFPVKTASLPMDIELYIDIEDFERRIRTLQDENKIPQEYGETASFFLQGVDLWREGKTSEDA